MTLIAEDLLLLLLDDDKGTLAQSEKIQPLLGGALLIELALSDRIAVPERTGLWRTAKVSLAPGAATASDALDPLLEAAMATIGEKERSAQDLVGRLGKGTKDVLLERLAERGMIRPTRDKILGLFPRTTWPAADREHESSVRALLHGPLVLGQSADERTLALISLLASVDYAHKVVERGDVGVKEIKARAKTIATGDWAAKAVRDAVGAAQAATTAAIVACGAAAASS